MKYYLLIIVAAFLIFSCNSDNKLIDNSDTSWELLASVASDPPSLSVINNDGEIVNNNVYASTGEEMPSAPSKIAEYGGMIFLLFKEDKQLVVINNKSYELIGKFDLEGTPSGLCFPNATDCYIALEDIDQILLLDIYNMKIAKSIAVGNRPINISAYGNQVYVPLFEDDRIAVIDTRTKTIEAMIQVPERPMYVDFTKDGKHCFVVSVGKGKVETEEEKTKSYVSFINVENREVLETTEIGFGSYLSENQFPSGIAVTYGDWAFIPTNEFLMRIDTRFGNRIRLIDRGNFESTIYNFKRDELLIIQDLEGDRKAFTADPEKAEELESIAISPNIIALLPM
jgi:DNA-binding beta-propeller fold protein YncE